MKKITLPLFLLLALCLIGGCANDIYGVPQNQWKTMTPAEQKMAMQSYYQRQRSLDRYQAEQDEIEARNAPVNNLIAGVVSAIPHHGFRHGYHYNHVRGHTEVHETRHCTYNGRSIPCNQMPPVPTTPSIPSGPPMPNMP